MKKSFYGLATAAMVALIVCSCGGNRKESSTSDKGKEAEKDMPDVGEVLHTKYFDVVVNQVVLSDYIDTGNPFSSEEAQPGTQFLIFNTTFTNTDKESRDITAGKVTVIVDDKEYVFDKAKMVMAEGWGIPIMKRLNPLVPYTTNLVYELPEGIKGPAGWIPGRAKDDEMIFLGNL